jgi:hypothetical protein
LVKGDLTWPAVQREQQVFTAMVVMRQRMVSSVDEQIGALGTGAGCDSNLILDRMAERLTGFALA